MTLATRTNLRVANAANESGTKKALRLAFRAGGVVGMFTVGLGLLGATIVLIVYDEDAPRVLEGFAFGGALLAMFMRVGGGIFTKAADVGADLVGKVEQGIPEDDPRNAATIADNVGDNVGDCAGMAADLFESYAVTLVAALILGQVAFGSQGLVFPLIVPAIGVLTALVGIYGTSPRDGDRNGMNAINRGFFLSAVVSAVLVAIAAFLYLPGDFAELDGGTESDSDPRLVAIGAVIIGIVLASLIQVLTGYFTETNRKPVRRSARARSPARRPSSWPASRSASSRPVYSALLIGGAVYAAFLLGGGSTIVALFAVALAGTGLLTTVGVIVAMDTFGPISDNAQGIAEMSGEVTEEGALVLTSLDAVGNTTKAITKGIAIATPCSRRPRCSGRSAPRSAGRSRSAAQRRRLQPVDRAAEPAVRPDHRRRVVFLFSGLAIQAVSRAAGRVVFEVREQFRTKPGIMDYTEKPDYGRVVDICTKDSLRELATPGLLAVLSPIAVGFALGYQPLGAFLAGSIAAGVLMAVFLSNSGGAWDNAKKLVEDGTHGGKGSPAHEATIIGDTVGDPFKDTAGPALNPLLKVMNLVALLIAPTVVQYGIGDDASLLVRFVIAALAIAGIVTAVTISNKRSVSGAVEIAESSSVTR
jgi:K(+)-stimulated pyrophosphate-energized sodium pump